MTPRASLARLAALTAVAALVGRGMQPGREPKRFGGRLRTGCVGHTRGFLRRIAGDRQDRLHLGR